MNRSIDRWTRRYVATSAVGFACWRIGVLLGADHGVEVAAALLGFVLPVVFGKAYLLIPSFAGRTLASASVPAVHLPLAAGGAIALVGARAGLTPRVVGVAGSAAWTLGVVLFLGGLLWTVGPELTRFERWGSGEDRWSARFALPFVGVALTYLLVGTAGLLAATTDGAVGTDPRTTHLFAAGTAGLLIVALGTRLLPGFCSADPPTAVVAVTLPAAAVGPGMLAVHLWGGADFRLAAATQAVGLLGWAVIVGTLFFRTSRSFVGFYGIAAGAAFGAVGAGLGVGMATRAGPLAALRTAHVDAMLAGFLSLTVVGFVLLFYPHTDGKFPGSDAAATAVVAALAAGVALQVLGPLLGGDPVTGVLSGMGDGLAALGATGFAAVVAVRLF
ncbi:hypothetical protein [Halostella pelagica]|uniref:hypothetical protein n=1 Tax=Halostella pelagica TaxID=2583824 RepID=UPI00107FEDCD|nr:hypothetical protein [Halostella pelagica]